MMATALRAFLMTRTDAKWSVSVHRDLEDLLDGWKSRPSAEQSVCVIHIGFDRPPAREFDAVADGWAGHMLVTASAKFGLPSGFVASDDEIGIVGVLPIYLGIRGWGYAVEATLIPKAKIGRAASADKTPTGWVRSFLDQHPEAAQEFEGCKIFDDSTYSAAEVGLSDPLRRAAGAYRLEQIIVGDTGDPCAFARAAPPWLLQQNFESLSVSVRVANVFTNRNIRTVADLGRCSLGELLDTQNFGRKSANDLLHALRTALEKGPDPDPLLESGAHYSTLIESLEASLFKYPERERDIMLRRIGLGRTPETLQDVGARYGVTRERIRQIEAKVTKRLIKEEIWDDLLTHKLAGLMDNRRVPLPLKGIEAVDSWFTGIGDEGQALVYLLANVSTGPAKVLQIDGTDYLGLITQEEWNDAVSGARRLLENGADREWTIDHCHSVVKAMLPEKCKEFRDLLWDQVSRQAQFVERNGSAVLVAFGRGAENLVQAVLMASDRPLHYSEIAALATKRSGREIDIRRAHQAAASIGLLFGRGTYGLDQHVPLSNEVMALLADEAEQIVVEGAPGRQWHTAELTTELIERGVAQTPGVDKYLTDIALKRSGNLESLGRLVWSGGDGDRAGYRIDVRQAIIASLRDAGKPLHTDEIRHRVMSMRGVDKLFQIAPVDPVMRIAPGLWGLNDRDISIKRADQPRLLNALVDLLRKRGSGLHHSEIGQSPVLRSWGLTATGFCSLATTDARLRVSTGRYLYLQEWGGPRRESLAEAVSAVFGSAGHPLAFDEIVDRVEARMGRPCERAAISASLVALDAAYDPTAGTWHREIVATAASDLEDVAAE